MRVQAAIGTALVALAAGARLPRSWSDTNNQIVTVTTTVLPSFCASAETNTKDQVITITTTTVSPKACTSSETQPITTTITETVYITLTLYTSPISSTISSNLKDGSACAVSKGELMTTGGETFATSTTAVSKPGGNDASTRRSTPTVTVYPTPVSESTTTVTLVSTEVITLTLTDVSLSSDLPDKPVRPPPITKADSSAQASQISVISSTPIVSSTIPPISPKVSPISSTSSAPSAPTLSTPAMPTTPVTPTTLSADHSEPYGPSGWNSTISATATVQGTSVQAVSRRPNRGSSKPDIISISKRQVGAIVTATINGQIVSWINNWNGGAISSLPTSTRTSIIDITRTISNTPLSTPTKCGETGEFTMDFDDLPRYSPSNNNTASFPPIFNPYNHLFFSDGWSYGPPPTEPYPPTSNPHIGIYVPEKNKNNSGSPYAGLLAGGEFGAGPRSSLNTLWFDAYSAYLGCDNGSANTTCAVTVSAVRYSTKINTEEAAGTRTFTLPPCPGYQNCTLSALDFGDSFRGISGLQFSASVQDKPVILFVDDIKMNWYNNTCAAGLERLRSR